MLDPRVLLGLALVLHQRWQDEDRERGDVPGWVLITVMTAGLVTAIWALLGGRIATLLNNALDSVTGPGSSG